MSLKRWHLSKKNTRRLHRMPARKRLGDYLRAGWLRRYRVKRVCRECHAARLRGDMEYIMKVREERLQQGEQR